MGVMQTVSVRIPSEDLEWLATVNLQGASTPSDKLRTLVAEFRKQQQGAADYAATLSRMRDFVSPFVTRVGAEEHRQGNHSEVVRLLTEWTPQMMALLVAEGGESPAAAREIEEKLVTRTFQLVASLLRLAILPRADCYDPEALEKHLPQIIDLVNVIAANRRSSNNTEAKHG